MGRGKAEPPPLPTFQNGEVRNGNKVVSKTYYDPKTNKVINEYIPDPAEQALKNLTLQKINQILPNIGNISPENYKDAGKIYVNDSTNQLNNSFDSSLAALRENIGARFGTLNSSKFIDDLSGLSKTKASALADIINKGKMLKYDLANQDSQKNLNILQALTGNFANGSSGANAANSQGSISNMNNYLQDIWNKQLENYKQQLQSSNGGIGKYWLWGKLFGG